MLQKTPSRGGRPHGTEAKDSDAVKRARQALGISQQEMAVQMGCSVSAVQRMERLEKLPQSGAMLDSFKRLARRAGVNIEAKTEEVTA